MKIKNTIVIVLLLNLFILNSTYAITSEEVINNFKKSFKNIKTLSLNFKQVINNTSLKNKQVIYGIIKIKKPDKLLMTYDKPEELRQKIIINNNLFLLYSEANKELVKKKISNSEKELEKQIFPWLDEINNFNIEIINEKENKIELKITPKQESQEKFKKFLIKIDSKTWLIDSTNMLDLNDTVIEFIFQDMKLEQVISDKEFEFTPPKDVEILEE